MLVLREFFKKFTFHYELIITEEIKSQYKGSYNLHFTMN